MKGLSAYLHGDMIKKTENSVTVENYQVVMTLTLLTGFYSIVFIITISEGSMLTSVNDFFVIMFYYSCFNFSLLISTASKRVARWCVVVSALASHQNDSASNLSWDPSA